MHLEQQSLEFRGREEDAEFAWTTEYQISFPTTAARSATMSFSAVRLQLRSGRSIIGSAGRSGTTELLLGKSEELHISVLLNWIKK
mmetsp:Transcript_12295/g.16139  ORF Transcript_12295/g.16139 Transcript_12295/m.16139 type:complete len:86 (-) Transcript_12295:7-264(-)